MPKRTSRRVYWSEPWGRYLIEIVQGRITHWPPIKADTGEWFVWLSQIPSFSFRARAGDHFTARKETRARGGAYWIAYRHRSGQLVKRYLGPSAQVTITRLEEVARDLVMRSREVGP